MLTCFVLPVNDIRQIADMVATIEQLQSAGGAICDEVLDWKDWAERKLQEAKCSIGISNGPKHDTVIR